MKCKRLAVFFLLPGLLALSACAGSGSGANPGRREEAQSDDTSGNPRTETEALFDNWFPALKDVDGIEGALWEAEVLGTQGGRLSVPGPTDVRARGFIFVREDVAEEWMRQYSFEEAAPDITSAYWDAADYEDAVWYRSPAFDDAYKPGYRPGNLYLSRYGIFFDVSAT